MKVLTRKELEQAGAEFSFTKLGLYREVYQDTYKRSSTS